MNATKRHPRLWSLVIAVMAAALLWPLARAGAADATATFDGNYGGSVTVTSARAVDCGATDFKPVLSVAGGVVSLVYPAGGAQTSVVLTGSVAKNGMFAGAGKGEYTINMAGSIRHGHASAKTWAWNCEYALSMDKGAPPPVAFAATASLRQ